MRSNIIRSVRQENTKPEIAVRELLTGLDYRYGLHRTDTKHGTGGEIVIRGGLNPNGPLRKQLQRQSHADRAEG